MKRPLRPGMSAMLLSAVFSAAMTETLYAARRHDPLFSSLAGSGIRVAVNCALAGILLGWRLPRYRSPPANAASRHPSRHHAWLLAWGFFGAVTVALFFKAVDEAGPGDASFFYATNGIFIAALSPLLLGERTRTSSWLSVAGSLVGLLLMQKSSDHGFSGSGALWGMGSGLAAALAWLMVSRAGPQARPGAIMLYWSGSCILLHAALAAVSPIVFPSTSGSWTLLIAAGIFASIAQYLSAEAFRAGPATITAALSYLAPVLCLAAEAPLFGIHHGTQAWAGAALVIGFGAVLPCVSTEPRIHIDRTREKHLDKTAVFS